MSDLIMNPLIKLMSEEEKKPEHDINEIENSLSW